jgi:hypothetical protein
MLFRRGQNAFESDDNQIIHEMRARILWAPAHEFLFEAAHAL